MHVKGGKKDTREGMKEGRKAGRKVKERRRVKEGR